MLTTCHHPAECCGRAQPALAGESGVAPLATVGCPGLFGPGDSAHSCSKTKEESQRRCGVGGAVILKTTHRLVIQHLPCSRPFRSRNRNLCAWKLGLCLNVAPHGAPAFSRQRVLQKSQVPSRHHPQRKVKGRRVNGIFLSSACPSRFATVAWLLTAPCTRPSPRSGDEPLHVCASHAPRCPVTGRAATAPPGAGRGQRPAARPPQSGLGHAGQGGAALGWGTPPVALCSPQVAVLLFQRLQTNSADTRTLFENGDPHTLKQNVRAS